MTDVKTLTVNLYGNPIGTLTLLQGDRSIFAFNDSYIGDPTRPTLSLSYKDEFGELITHSRPTQTRLTPFFSNLLPEGHMRDYLAKHAGVKQVREFHLLWALGADLPGAVTVASPDGGGWITKRVVDESNQAMRFSDELDALKVERTMRFSLAGVQMKFSAIAEASGGLTIPVDGVGGSWIVKLPSSRFDHVPENEFSMMTLAKEIGIDVPEHRLIDPKVVEGLPDDVDSLTEPAFAVKRFDRMPDGERIHMEDFAQVFGVYPADRYKKASYRVMAHVIWIEIGKTGIEEFIRRLVYSTLIGNADMHLKNWSLLYHDRRTPQLSPAYDFVSTIPYIRDGSAALKYARHKRMQDLSLDELRYLAAKAGAPETLVVSTAISTAEAFHDAWRSTRMHLPLTTRVRQAIDNHYRNIAFFKAL